MKRDMDLVRGILLWIERQDSGRNVGWTIEIDGFTGEQIGYHIYLMGQAGLLEAHETTSMSDSSPSAMPIALTWSGHEFIDATKDEEIWAKAKKTVLNTSKSFTSKVLMKWLEAQATAVLPGIG